jgi:hypothetical protein
MPLSPERADVYICDKCGRDITEDLRPGHPQATIIGPETFLCSCSAKYRTGAMEWDNLGRVGRQQQVWAILILGGVLSAFSSILAVPIYFILKLFAPALAVVVGIAVGVTPFVFSQPTFWPEVIASV